LDRIDLQIQVAAVPFRELAADYGGEGSEAMRSQVSQARQVQERRFARVRRVFANAQMTVKMVQEHCALAPEARRLLDTAVERLGLSARAYTRILKIARTIADLEGAADIALPHVAEAVQYRTLDRQFSSPQGVRFARETAERYLV
jgi:magnesium chelatase family protein